MHSLQLPRWRNWLLYPAIVAAVVLAVAVAASVVAARVDQQTRLREQSQVAHGLAGWVQEIENRIVGQVNWDDAVQNLGIAYDAGWARTNIGQFLHDMVGLDQAFVIDATGQPVYAMVDGVDAAPARYSALANAAEPLIASVRRAEARRAPLQPQPPFDVMLTRPIQSSEITTVADGPAIVTASLVQPDFGTVGVPAVAPVLVTVERINGPFLSRFAQRFLLADLRLDPAAGALASDRAAHRLVDRAGGPIARLTWRQQTPGQALVRSALPPILLVVGLLVAATIALAGRARRGAQALIASESRSNYIAFHDHLTGLPNRALFHDRLAVALRSVERGADPIGVFLIDLDRFKTVNDCYGHGAGDALIIEIAARLKRLLRSSDTICRLGGDEFALLCTSVMPKGLAALAKRITEELAEPVDLEFGRVYVGASVGVTVVAGRLGDPGDALRQADLAMYAAKEAGGSAYRFFEPEMDFALKARQSLEADLRDALENGDLTMVYQPQVDRHRKMFGVEALVRWEHPLRGAVPPSIFVAIAEEGGLIEALGLYTFRQAFADSLLWPDLTVSVNVSAVQLRSLSFLGLIRQVLHESGADPHRIELEITEGVLLNDDPGTHSALNGLRELGFRIALDDFGTGYSSLSYLRKYPVDKIKIDRSFITNLGDDHEAEAVVGAIVRLAGALSLEVIAEGVETSSQLAGLRRAGCPQVQGYLYSRPLTADRIEGFTAEAPVSA